MFNTRAEPPLSPAHRAISARSLHRLAAIDLRPAPALLLAERDDEGEEQEKRRRGRDEGTHAYACVASALGEERCSRAIRATPEREFVAPNCSPGEIPAPGRRIARSPNIRRFLERTCTHKSSIISRTLNTRTGTPSRHASLMYSRGNIITLESFSVTCPFTRSTCQSLHQ